MYYLGELYMFIVIDVIIGYDFISLMEKIDNIFFFIIIENWNGELFFGYDIFLSF